MRKNYRIRKSQEFSEIIKNKHFYSSSVMTIYVREKKEDVCRIGISVKKKIGNAVVRNKLKRQLRSIISKNDYQNNFNCIIILGKGILAKNYQQMDNNLQDAFKKLNILLGGANEEK